MLSPISTVALLVSIICRNQVCSPQADIVITSLNPVIRKPVLATYRLPLGKYRLLKAFPNVLIRLPTVAPPSCILLASASSSADCVTDASVIPSQSTTYPSTERRKKKGGGGKGGRKLTIKITETTPHARRPVAPLALPLNSQLRRPSRRKRPGRASLSSRSRRHPARLSRRRGGTSRRVARLALPQRGGSSSALARLRPRGRGGRLGRISTRGGWWCGSAEGGR